MEHSRLWGVVSELTGSSGAFSCSGVCVSRRTSSLIILI
jgi:hypothetical protein